MCYLEGLHQTKKVLTVNETINKMKRQSNEWEKICKQYIHYQVTIQNTQRTNATQHQKTNNSIEKWKQKQKTFSQRRHIDGQQTCEKMLDITNC